MIETVDAIMIVLEVDTEQILFLMLASDGSINRSGTGTLEWQKPGMFIGITKEPLFEELRAEISPAWFDQQGVYDAREKKGRSCELTISMKHNDGRQTDLLFRYGSKSMGPPADVNHFVKRAVTITDPWFHRQLKLVAKSDSDKKTPRE